MFAPSNDAFLATLADLNMTAAEVLTDDELLQSVLFYHIVPGVAAKAESLTNKQALPTMLVLEGDEPAQLEVSGSATCLGVQNGHHLGNVLTCTASWHAWLVLEHGTAAYLDAVASALCRPRVG